MNQVLSLILMLYDDAIHFNLKVDHHLNNHLFRHCYRIYLLCGLMVGLFHLRLIVLRNLDPLVVVSEVEWRGEER